MPPRLDDNGSSTLRERFRTPHHQQCPGSSYNGFRPPGEGCFGGLGFQGSPIRAAHIPGGVGATMGMCEGGTENDGLAGSPGLSRNTFEATFGELPECFNISQEAQAQYPVEIQRAIQNVKYIHNHMIRQDKFDEEDDEWAFVAMVLDRLLLWLFGLISIVGTVTILCESPFLYDSTLPLDIQISEVFQKRQDGIDF
ncbi:Neurotransmitter-gated ion-channel ligand binding domain [Halocaridina rubra]|uniref:Neurotransmitter-gated ion-channel ligand binding domain n=1 Tax=Halocaridina rubra TaxID=373956 RepID=A0AAN9A6U9_HALRR